MYYQQPDMIPGCSSKDRWWSTLNPLALPWPQSTNHPLLLPSGTQQLETKTKMDGNLLRHKFFFISIQPLLMAPPNMLADQHFL
jgi:hypothetical protein